jgi:hypothetical protein
MKHLGYTVALLVLAACSFQPVSPLSELPLEPQASYWEQLGTFVSQGLTPDIAFDSSGKPFAAYSSGNFIYVREWSVGGWNLLGGVLAGSFAGSPSLVVNGAGQPVIAWHEKIGSSFNIYVYQWNGFDWLQVGSPLDVALANDATFPTLGVDSTGTPTVAWQEYDGTGINIYVKRWNGSSWLQLGNALDINLSHNAYEPDLSLDASGKPVVTWSESDGNVYVKRWSGTGWVKLGGPLDGVLTDFSVFPSLALDASGTPFVAFQECVNSCSHYDVYVKRWNGTSWLQLGGAVDTTLTRNAENPSIAVSSTGKPSVLWREGIGFSNDDLYAKQWTGSSWAKLGEMLDVSPANNVLYPALVLDPKANPVAIWQENNGSSDTLYVKRWLANVWQPYGDLLNVNDPVFYSGLLPSLALTSSNTPVVAWYESSGSEQIVYTKYWSGQRWVRYGTSVASGSYPSLALPSSNLPYVAFNQYSGTHYNVLVKRWDGVQWLALGGALDTTLTYSASRPKLVLDSLTRPVVVWEERQVTSTNDTLYVKRWDGATWQALGGPLDKNSARDADTASIAIDSQDRSVVVWNERVGSESVLNYNIYVKRWTGTGWQFLGGALNVSSASWAFQPTVAIDSTNSPVVAWEEVNADKVKVYVKRWNGSSWVTLGGAVNDTGTDANTGSLSIAIDSANNPVVAFGVRPGSVSPSNPDIFVKRWTGSSWVKIGGVVDRFVENSAGFPSLVLTSQNKPVVAWHEQKISGGTISNPVVYVSGY